MKTIAVCNNRPEAEILKAKLESSGIIAVITADDEGGLHPGLSLTQGVRVSVPSKSEAKAHEIINLTYAICG